MWANYRRMRYEVIANPWTEEEVAAARRRVKRLPRGPARNRLVEELRIRTRPSYGPATQAFFATMAILLAVAGVALFVTALLAK